MITVQKETTINPLQLMGEEGGICWNSDLTDSLKNKRRGLECIRNGHGRVAEFPQIYLTIDGYSARVLREVYTHIGGCPTRLQSSTRYVDGESFDYIIPNTIRKNNEALEEYIAVMNSLHLSIGKLKELGIHKEDYANLLPLGMTSKMVLRTNLRALIDMFKVRTCSRAYWEYRELMQDIKKALSEYSDEWKEVAEEFFKTKCDYMSYCDERYSCGRFPQK